MFHLFNFSSTQTFEQGSHPDFTSPLPEDPQVHPPILSQSTTTLSPSPTPQEKSKAPARCVSHSFPPSL